MLFPNESVLETASFSIHQDREVPIPGFFVIATKRKIRSIADFTPKEAQEFIILLCKLRKGMQKVLDIHVVYLFENEDTDPYFHL